MLIFCSLEERGMEMMYLTKISFMKVTGKNLAYEDTTGLMALM
jgi:hypothetical protein